ncbi:MAG: hypothetical protein QT05_C0003G0021 [archaeon GW2011_AR13]|nr:MAG: hypothetical protein QT05_C0003G0021 [archaeon GW2011_AR13]HIG94214.1 hypothetical protein [Nanoarchaeota archaeon]HIH62676.1 hypothetical protein [Nanoarchaeota archaeon]HIJ09883.1 hypothetical protein [Nanoarchaeota archaeon]
MADEKYVINRIIEHLQKISNTQYDLKKGAMLHDDFYIVTGCYHGSEKGMTKTKFLKGHPLDIIGQHIEDNDFFSTSSVGQETYNLYAGRILFLASDIALNSSKKNEVFHNRFWPNKEFFAPVSFYFENGVLKPLFMEIKPEDAKKIEYLTKLKQASNFESISSQIIGPKKSRNLVNHLFSKV